MTTYLEVFKHKKTNKWRVRKALTNRSLAAIDFNTIEEAEDWARNVWSKPKSAFDRPWIDRVIGTSKGHLIPLNKWKESCDDGGFIDYDGYGSPIDENYEFIRGDESRDYFDNVIRPSDYTEHGGKKIPPNTKYILWYNK